jgi:hypothetical protein
MFASVLTIAVLASTSLYQPSTEAPAVRPAPVKLRCEVINVGTFSSDAKMKRVCGTREDWKKYYQLMQKRSRAATQDARW